MIEGKNNNHMDEQVRIVCPSCGFSKDLPSHVAPSVGKLVTCPKCACRFPFVPEDPQQNISEEVPVVKTSPSKVMAFVKFTLACVVSLFVLLVIIAVYFNNKEGKALDSSVFIQELNSAEKAGDDVFPLLVDNLKDEEKGDESLVFQWLDKRRDKGDLPYLYFMGLYQAKRGKQEKGFKYIAAGSLVYRVDAERCGDSTSNQAVPIIERRFGLPTIYGKLKENQSLQQEVVSWAMSYEETNLERQRPDWICAHGMSNFTGTSQVPTEKEWLNNRQEIREKFQEQFKVSSSEATEINKLGPYHAEDSGAWTYPSGSEKTFWLDNERILFVSNRILAPGGGESILTIWNPSTSQIDFSHEVQGLICAEGDQVFWVEKDKSTGSVKFYRSSLESPEEHPPPNVGERQDNVFDCDWAPTFSRATVPYSRKLKGGNYLEVLKQQTASVHGEAQYYERLDLPPVSLPVYAEPYGKYDIRFNKLKNAYFISPGWFYPEEPYFHSMWWLQRNGKLAQESLPENLPWPSIGGLTIYPLFDGYLAHYKGGPLPRRGFYSLKGETVEPVLFGSIHGVSVSPDGCSVAFIYAKDTDEYFSREKPHRTVKMINFCEE